jgi:hypothetical protein
MPADPGLVFWLLAVLHFVGLTSMFLSRLPHSHRMQAFSQHIFLTSLVIVGVATFVTICVQSTCWVWTGTTFSIMAVGATADLGTAARTSGI